MAYCSVLWWLFPPLFAHVLVAWKLSSIHLKHVTIEFYGNFIVHPFLLNSCSIHSLIFLFFTVYSILLEKLILLLVSVLKYYSSKMESPRISAFPRLSQRHSRLFSYEHWGSVPCSLCLLNLLLTFIGKSFYSWNSI